MSFNIMKYLQFNCNEFGSARYLITRIDRYQNRTLWAVKPPRRRNEEDLALAQTSLIANITKLRFEPINN
jgi:hypothetical protein